MSSTEQVWGNYKQHLNTYDQVRAVLDRYDQVSQSIFVPKVILYVKHVTKIKFV